MIVLGDRRRYASWAASPERRASASRTANTRPIMLGRYPTKWDGNTYRKGRMWQNQCGGKEKGRGMTTTYQRLGSGAVENIIAICKENDRLRELNWELTKVVRYLCLDNDNMACDDRGKPIPVWPVTQELIDHYSDLGVEAGAYGNMATQDLWLAVAKALELLMGEEES